MTRAAGPTETGPGAGRETNAPVPSPVRDPWSQSLHPMYRRDAWLLAFCGLFLGLTVAYPTARLLWEAATHWPGLELWRGARGQAVGNTVAISFATVATAGLFGTALAFLFERFTFSGRTVLAALAYLPFALPPLVGTITFYYLIGEDGFIPRWLQAQYGWVRAVPPGPVAILLIHTYSFYVFFYAMVGAALQSLDPSLVEAARTLGASRTRVFLRVVLPQLRPALLGAGLLAFMSSGASFSAPLIFGNDFPMLSVQIYQERDHGDTAMATALSVVLALTALLGVLVFRARARTGGRASKGARAPLRGAGARATVTALAWGTVALLLVPHATILWLSLVDHRAWHAELLPTTFTLANYASIFRDPGAVAPLRNSVWMSALAAALCLAVGLPAAYLVGRKRPGGRWINLLVMLPWALPGTVIAMNLIVAFNDPWLPLYGTVWMLPLAYFVRGIPLLTRMATAAVEPFDGSLVEAGRSLGATPWFCFVHVVAPLLAPAILAGTALVFTTSLGEFVASILVYSAHNIPVAVKINMVWRGSGIGAAFAYGVVLMVLVGATYVVSRRLGSRVV